MLPCANTGSADLLGWDDELEGASAVAANGGGAPGAKGLGACGKRFFVQRK